MSYNSKVYRIVISSPSDVPDERESIKNVIFNWNAVNSENMKVVLLPVMWEIDSYPQLGNRPQEILNKQIIEHSDLLIAVFWSKIGTPTGLYESGTIEEIEKFLKAGKPVMLYFGKIKVDIDNIDIEQFKKLKKYKEDYKKRGLYHTYSTLEDFQKKLISHLSMIIQDIHKKANGNKIDNQNTTIAKFLDKEFRKLKAKLKLHKSQYFIPIDETKNIFMDFSKKLSHIYVEYNSELEESILNNINEIIVEINTQSLSSRFDSEEGWNLCEEYIYKIEEIIKQIPNDKFVSPSDEILI